MGIAEQQLALLECLRDVVEALKILAHRVDTMRIEQLTLQAMLEEQEARKRPTLDN